MKVEETVKHYETHKSIINRDNTEEYLREVNTRYSITSRLWKTI